MQSRPDELMDIFYGLVLPLEEMLPGYDGQRQYVIAVGDEEFLIDPDSLDPVRYEDIDRLARVLNSGTPGDYLTVRLFLQHDPENLLWEWAFGKNGLQIVFEYPGDELIVAPEVETINGRATELYRMLGGVRLHYRFNFPQGAVPHSMEMWIDRTGRVCPEMPTQVAGCITHTATPGPVSSVRIGQWTQADVAAYPIARHQWGLYWEPEDWSLGLDARRCGRLSYWMGNILVQYTDRPLVQAGLVTSDHEPIIAQIRNRLLQPVASDPMQGTDVAMLEAMLWQLGLSPQWGFPGKSATRIDSVRRTYTQNQQPQDCGRDLHKPRDRYSVGFVRRGPQSGWNQADICGRREATIEAMVRRFKGRSFETNYLSSHGQNQDGVVDEATMSQLVKVWRHYIEAFSYARNMNVPNRFGSLDIPFDWWQDVLSLQSSGGHIPFESSTGQLPVYHLPRTYDASTHQAVVLDFPSSAMNITLAGVIHSWIDQESGGNFWGNGDPRTAYRMEEGSADEMGSMGFNHILWMRMYGQERSCDSNRGYLGSTPNVNLYNPRNSLYAFLAAAASQDCSSSNGLYRAYVRGDYRRPIAVDPPVSYCYETVNGTNRTSSCAQPAADWRDFYGNQDDDYMLLGKAMIAYNMGTRARALSLHTHSYFQFLQGAPRGSLTWFGYWLGVKEKSWALRNSIDGYLPYVQYRWAGEHYPATTTDANGNIIPHPQAGEPVWCFVYGEREWRSGTSYQDTLDAANGDPMAMPPISPVGRVHCATGVPLP
ncbi:MAG: hypothetical protein M1305_01755, partial [Candidatus Marsarchaeota archaeon]|nr:hypothetical protein [Candidatus Marsarchaeota archaeon]